MTESADYTPAPHWQGHDFKSARTYYDRHAGRSYDTAVQSGKKMVDLIEPSLATNASAALIVLIDETGSMGEWPKIMFSKLPYLEHEAQEYLGKDLDICFGAIGDAHNNEKYPLQVRPFTRGADLKARLEELVMEGKGGGQLHESYELAAMYFARNVSMPRLIRKPVLIFTGDEQPYEMVDRAQAQSVAQVALPKSLPTAEVFEELKKIYSVYLVRKPYGTNTSNKMDDENRAVYSHWMRLLGPDHIFDLPDPDRVVDVIFGILAYDANRIEDFQNELEGRQDPKQVSTVYKSLRLDTPRIVAAPEHRALTEGHSTLHNPSRGLPSKPLL